jgi:hypothetical protein
MTALVLRYAARIVFMFHAIIHALPKPLRRKAFPVSYFLASIHAQLSAEYLHQMMRTRSERFGEETVSF